MKMTKGTTWRCTTKAMEIELWVLEQITDLVLTHHTVRVVYKR